MQFTFVNLRRSSGIKKIIFAWSALSLLLETEKLIVITPDHFVSCFSPTISFDPHNCLWKDAREKCRVDMIIHPTFPIYDNWNHLCSFFLVWTPQAKLSALLERPLQVGDYHIVCLLSQPTLITFIFQSPAWDVALSKDSVSAFRIYWTREWI